MRRHLTMLLTACLGMLVIAGCSDEGAETAEYDSSATEREQELEDARDAHYRAVVGTAGESAEVARQLALIREDNAERGYVDMTEWHREQLADLHRHHRSTYGFGWWEKIKSRGWMYAVVALVMLLAGLAFVSRQLRKD